jgi:hypothetical protein
MYALFISLVTRSDLSASLKTPTWFLSAAISSSRTNLLALHLAQLDSRGRMVFLGVFFDHLLFCRYSEMAA